jgi:hypothetical protein
MSESRSFVRVGRLRRLSIILFVNTKTRRAQIYGEIDSPQATVRFFDLATGQTAPVAEVGGLVKAGPSTLAFSPDETSLLYVPAGRDNRDIMLVRDFR